MKRWIIGSLLATFAVEPTLADQFKSIKDIEVHYSAFNSTFLTDQVAQRYGIRRNSHSAIINIVLLDNARTRKPATTAKISGISKNLIGHVYKLAFKEIKEGNSIYYLAEFPITNEENIFFDLDINAGNKGIGKLQFRQIFYIER
ncbi:DUF4426 domain-containing protein [Candidatus Photodesmus blepharus]|uniref:DUF4426 domain-containing protein n=1 Tax=Candidatus Photodesmus blepharonis TaxID=1179155 RepID=UPI0005542356|nr:DUF4426 domain-containing protein [Candidatus Photodesmus blepharus]